MPAVSSVRLLRSTYRGKPASPHPSTAITPSPGPDHEAQRKGDKRRSSSGKRARRWKAHVSARFGLENGAARKERHERRRESVSRSGKRCGRNGRAVGAAQRPGVGGVVHKTAPMQVVERMKQANPLEDRPLAKRGLALATHFAYGTAAGAAFGALRREREGPATELAVGATLGVLLWGIGWAGYCGGSVGPDSYLSLGAARAPWSYNTPRALLPVLDHAVYGAVWGLLFWAFSRRKDRSYLTEALMLPSDLYAALYVRPCLPASSAAGSVGQPQGGPPWGTQCTEPTSAPGWCASSRKRTSATAASRWTRKSGSSSATALFA
jgi:hypothetical protein